MTSAGERRRKPQRLIQNTSYVCTQVTTALVLPLHRDCYLDDPQVTESFIWLLIAISWYQLVLHQNLVLHIMTALNANNTNITIIYWLEALGKPCCCHQIVITTRNRKRKYKISKNTTVPVNG